MADKTPPRWITLPVAREPMTNEDDVIQRWINDFCTEAASLVPSLIRQLRGHEGFMFVEWFSKEQIENTFFRASKNAIEKLLDPHPGYRQLIIDGQLNAVEVARQLAPLIAKTVVSEDSE